MSPARPSTEPALSGATPPHTAGSSRRPDVRNDRRIGLGTVVGGGRYRIDDEIGTGGMAVVYEAFDHTLGRPVALKVVAARYADRADTEERYTNERRLADALDEHPNVVQPLDVGRLAEFDNRLYLAADLVTGRPLAALVLEQPRGLPIHQVVRVARGAARALVALHARGIVHRDIKPGNLMLANDGPAAGTKLLDFGCAYALGTEQVEASADLTLAHQRVGTAIYMAPEQAVGLRPTPAFDVYALGATLYELLSGAAPYAGSSTAEITRRKCAPDDPPRSIARRRSGVPPQLAAIVDECLARDPDDRPTADALRRRLEALAETLGLGPDDDAPAVRARSTTAMPPDAAGDASLDSTELAPPIVAREPTEVAAFAPHTSAQVGSPPEPRRTEPAPRILPWALAGGFAVGAIGLGLLLLGDLDRPETGSSDTPQSRDPGPSAAVDDSPAATTPAGSAGAPDFDASPATDPTPPTVPPAPLLGSTGPSRTDTDAPVDTTAPGGDTGSPDASPEPKPRGHKPRPPTTPRFATPACAETRRATQAARTRRQWSEVLQAVTTDRKCWEDTQQRQALHVAALAGLHRYAQCVATAQGSRDRQVRRMAKQCQHKLQEATP